PDHTHRRRNGWRLSRARDWRLGEPDLRTCQQGRRAVPRSDAGRPTPDLRAQSRNPRQVKRRPLLLLLLALGLPALSAALALYVARGRSSTPTHAAAASPARAQATVRRIASLSPAITDTIVALGAEPTLVLVSDYCQLTQLPRGGTIISPRFERLASVQPDLIVATHFAGSPEADLERVAPLLSLRWLTLDEVVHSIRKLGAAVARQPQADALARRMERELAPRDTPDAPRVLLLLGPLGEERIGYFFVRNESLHGRLLTASG